MQLRRLKENPDDTGKESFKVGPYTVTENGHTFDIKGQVDNDFDIKLLINPDTNESSISIGKNTNLDTIDADTLISQFSKVIKYAKTIDDDIYAYSNYIAN